MKAADQQLDDAVDTDVVDSLRAALDLERSTSQHLTETLQQQHEHVTRLTSELSQLGEQLSAERSVVRNNTDAALVSACHSNKPKFHLARHVLTRLNMFDVSRPCIWPVWSLSNSTAQHARLNLLSTSNMSSCRDVA